MPNRSEKPDPTPEQTGVEVDRTGKATDEASKSVEGVYAELLLPGSRLNSLLLQMKEAFALPRGLGSQPSTLPPKDGELSLPPDLHVKGKLDLGGTTGPITRLPHALRQGPFGADTLAEVAKQEFNRKEDARVERKLAEMGKGSYTFVDLTSQAHFENLQSQYASGDQLRLLSDILDVEWLARGGEDSFEGEWFAVFRKDGRIFFLSGASGDDGWNDFPEGTDPRAWSKEHLAQAKSFTDREAFVAWLQASQDFLAGVTPSSILQELGERSR